MSDNTAEEIKSEIIAPGVLYLEPECSNCAESVDPRCGPMWSISDHWGGDRCGNCSEILPPAFKYHRVDQREFGGRQFFVRLGYFILAMMAFSAAFIGAAHLYVRWAGNG